jgi:hypothetical protein
MTLISLERDKKCPGFQVLMVILSKMRSEYPYKVLLGPGQSMILDDPIYFLAYFPPFEKIE